MGLFSKKEDATKNSQSDIVIAEYKVNYRGGHPDYPKAKSGSIIFQVLEDRIDLLPTTGTKSWFKGLQIEHVEIKSLKIVERQVGTAEGILGGLDSRQLNQANNIHISTSLGGKDIVLRLEMLSGVSVMGQARKCKELEDRLRNSGIYEKFSVSRKNSSSVDISEELTKLAKLHDRGVISEVEFKRAKSKLLG